MTLILMDAGGNGHTKIEVWELDLANYESVFNAGIRPDKFEPADGLQSTLTVNVVSTFLSCMIVLPKLRETSGAYDTTTNLTATGSVYHIFGPDSELDTGEDDDIFHALSDPNTADMLGRYAQSKLVIY
ncbi:hypothetical protein QQZ08_006209 [Neonectria magnoliae]|uniref:Uncharacterized protein n=1 Tax=Neonectria magnoliae TaxID=2732573 RepID=A0ABR1I181_9HYPO